MVGADLTRGECPALCRPLLPSALCPPNSVTSRCVPIGPSETAKDFAKKKKLQASGVLVCTTAGCNEDKGITKHVGRSCGVDRLVDRNRQIKGQICFHWVSGPRCQKCLRCWERHTRNNAGAIVWPTCSRADPCGFCVPVIAAQQAAKKFPCQMVGCTTRKRPRLGQRYCRQCSRLVWDKEREAVVQAPAVSTARFMTNKRRRELGGQETGRQRGVSSGGKHLPQYGGKKKPRRDARSHKRMYRSEQFVFARIASTDFFYFAWIIQVSANEPGGRDYWVHFQGWNNRHDRWLSARDIRAAGEEEGPMLRKLGAAVRDRPYYEATGTDKSHERRARGKETQLGAKANRRMMRADGSKSVSQQSQVAAVGGTAGRGVGYAWSAEDVEALNILIKRDGLPSNHGPSTAELEMGWDSLAVLYNAERAGRPRSMESIKNKFGRMQKKKASQQIASQRRHDGGSSDFLDEPWRQSPAAGRSESPTAGEHEVEGQARRREGALDTPRSFHPFTDEPDLSIAPIITHPGWRPAGTAADIGTRVAVMETDGSWFVNQITAWSAEGRYELTVQDPRWEADAGGDSDPVWSPGADGLADLRMCYLDNGVHSTQQHTAPRTAHSTSPNT